MVKKDLFSKPVRRRTLAEQVAETIKELILSGELKAGEPLPTEPELSEQFGVSRAVVRDATRMLMGWGLVDVRHGSGMYVTVSQTEAFGEALLIALRRAWATAWDVEQFQQVVVPEVVALAAVAAEDEEIAVLQSKIAMHSYSLYHYYQLAYIGEKMESSEEQAMWDAGREITRGIFEASHNALFAELAEPLLALRNLRHWADDDPLEPPHRLAKLEVMYYQGLLDAIASRDPAQARAKAQMLMALPPEAVQAMKETPVGEQPQIPISIMSLWEQGWREEG